MNQNLISKINGIDIMTVEKEGETYVPVKPICRALSIDYTAQRQRIMRHYILSSTVVTLTTVAADDKDREMLCLPLEFVYGWLFTIDVNLVAESRREQVDGYQRECYEALYNYFQQKARRATEQAQAEAALLSEKLSFEKSIKECEAQVRRIDEQLARLQSERLSPQPTLFE